MFLYLSLLCSVSQVLFFGLPFCSEFDHLLPNLYLVVLLDFDSWIIFGTFACLVCLIVYGLLPVTSTLNQIISAVYVCLVLGLLFVTLTMNLVTSTVLFSRVQPLLT